MAAGILLSRLLGLVRTRVFAHYFGTSDAADAFNAAFRIPNLLQNLLGEGVLSASFIPVYARLLAAGDVAEARRTANAVAALLGFATAVAVAAGVVAAPWLVEVIAPGFAGEKRAATVGLVRILFPGAGLLVLSAWCLGVLNSHGRFFLSYAAPVAWNLAIIVTLVAFNGGAEGFRLAEVAAWGSVAGSALQLGVQLPAVAGLVGALGARVRHSEPVRAVLRSFGPVLLGRGVVQVSAYVDTLLASLLPTGAVAGLAYAQVIYTLPVSLFGMSVSAAELPAMAGATGHPEEQAAYLRARLEAGLRRIAFFVVPSAAAFVALGDVVVGVLYQSGEFTRAMTVYVWGILAASAIGLLASTLGRLYASTFYALRDTRTPLRFAALRVGLGVVLGWLAAVPAPLELGLDPRWGAAGLAAASGVAACVEFVLLRRGVGRRIGPAMVGTAVLASTWASAAAAATLVWTIRLVVPAGHPLVLGLFFLGTYGAAYLGLTHALGLPEARAVLGRLIRRPSGR